MLPFKGYDGNGFEIGSRVELHPGTDQWMQGDRFGNVYGSRPSPAGPVPMVQLDSRRKLAVPQELLRVVP